MFDGMHPLPERFAGDQRMAGGRLQAEAAGGVALRIEIDQQRPRARLGHRPGEVHGRRGFSHAAFLIGHAVNPNHFDIPTPFGRGCGISASPIRGRILTRNGEMREWQFFTVYVNRFT